MKMKNIWLILIFLWSAAGTGCAVIAGSEDTGQALSPAIDLRFVESLRSQESLRGEGWEEPQQGTPPATSLQQPHDVYADAFRVYVTDTYQSASIQQPRIFVFDRGNRTAIDLLTPAPPAEGKLLAPSGITVDATNVIYVADSQQGVVFGYDGNGQLLMVLGRAGDLGKPVGLASDHNRGRLYVVDAAGRRVRVLDSFGKSLFDIGVSGPETEQFRSPAAIALDREGTIYVLDRRRRRVYVYDPDARLLRTFSLAESGMNGPLKPTGIAVDSDGHVYVTDSVSNNVLIFGKEGNFIQTWGRNGILIGDFWTPAGIFIDSMDKVYIADQMNGRVQVFQYSK